MAPESAPGQHQGCPRLARGGPALDAALAQAELAKLRETLSETKIALAQAERDVSRREVELLRERLADARAERDRLHALLREVLARPSLIERLLRAVRGTKA